MWVGGKRPAERHGEQNCPDKERERERGKEGAKEGENSTSVTEGGVGGEGDWRLMMQEGETRLRGCGGIC